MRALIVDDEPLARALLRKMLERQDVEVIGESEDAEEAIALAEELAPDVIFLDVRMPGMGGLDATALFAEFDNPPLVILVTGYSEHALDAFDRSALDYILKPVAPERLATSLEKVKHQLALRSKARRADQQARPNRVNLLQRLPIRFKGSIRLLPVDKIIFAIASEKSVIIKCKDAEFRTSYTLTQLTTVLPPAFMRVHSSCIVNLAMIQEILLEGNHSYAIKLLTGEELPLGRSQYQEVQRRLGFSSS